MKKKYFSFIVVILLFEAGLYKMLVDVRPWQKELLVYDIMDYYSYLPATFIEHDPSLSFIDRDGKPDNYWSRKMGFNISPTGMKYSKMTYGMSILYAPLFFIAHVIAKPLGYPPDGFSPPYQVAIGLSGLIYIFIGLFILRKVLLRFFSDKITAFTLLCIGAGTNLAYYATYEGAMSHGTSFCLFAAFILLTIKWSEKPGFTTTLLLGLCFTLITLVRASNIIVIILPLLYGISNKKTLVAKLQFLMAQRKNLIIVSGICFLLFIPQFLYWKLVSGHYIFYAYDKENFFFSHPHILKGFFGYRKGWLLYTPIMSFALIGLYFLRKRVPAMFIPTILFVVLNSWIVLSWWCWWYGGSFGMRSFVESYALLAIPFASFMELAFRRLWSAIAIVTVSTFFCLLNSFQLDQCSVNLIHYDSMSKSLYWKVFFTKSWPPDYDKLLEPPDYENAVKGLPEDK